MATGGSSLGQHNEIGHDSQTVSAASEPPAAPVRSVVAPGARDGLDGSLLAQLARDVRELREGLVAAELQWAPFIARVDESNVSGAVNLVHYWAVRQVDLRDLQQRLAAFGLSSLGRLEPHVKATLDAVATAIDALSGQTTGHRDPVLGFGDGPRLLRQHSEELFGPAPSGRQTRIMVTLPSEAAGDPTLVRDLVEQGMDLARVNCAHDGPDDWAAMITGVRAAADTGRSCRVAMDLAGPKLRTGPLAAGPQVLKLHPARDALGRVVTPARCWLSPVDNPIGPADPGVPVLTVPGEWLARLTVADTVSFHDARDAHRTLKVVAVERGGALVAVDRTAYVVSGTELRTPKGHRADVGVVPATEMFLTLHIGDRLTLTRDCTPAAVTPGGPARIGCSLPEAFGHVRRGQSVHLDDGRISGVVRDTDADQFTIEVTDAAVEGSRLRAEKGINLPDTVLPVAALTATDRGNLAFVAAHADVVELSFVRTPRDVEDLLAALSDLGDGHLGVVLKIETSLAFQNLPAILLTLMRHPRSGVMIARGDLASECGYERLAELQEEILWLSEAAHLPAIWATQVLDQMARSGQPSRAEITDAAMGARAECVMLNKGPHILDAVAALGDILTRMTTHHDKKISLMRPLRSWHSSRS